MHLLYEMKLLCDYIINDNKTIPENLVVVR